MQKIKTILVPLDFSDPSNNALDYAIEFAKKASARIILLHVYNVPLVSVKSDFVSHPELAVENAVKREQELKALAAKLSQLNNIDFEIKTMPMNWSIELPGIIHQQRADLIIMGTSGAGGLNDLMGSNTAKVIEELSGPVLAIPHQSRFNGINKIGFAFDQELIEDFSSLEFLVSVAELFQAHISIFHIKHQSEAASEDAFRTASFSEYFRLNHTYEEIISDDIAATINRFAETQNIDILSMMPRRRRLFHKMMKGSITKKLVIYGHTPLLAIPV